MNSIAQKHPSVIETASPEVYLRHHSAEDAPEIRDLIIANRDHLGVHMGWWLNGLNLRAIGQGAAQRIEEMNQDKMLSYRAVDRSTERIFGTVAMFNHDKEAGRAEISYWIDGNMQGRGYAIAAARALTQYAFQAWGDLNQVVAKIREDNVRSQNCIKKLGAQPDPLTYFLSDRNSAEYRTWRIVNE